MTKWACETEQKDDISREMELRGQLDATHQR